MKFTFGKSKALAAGLAVAMLAVFSYTVSRTPAYAHVSGKAAPITVAAGQNEALDFDLVNATGYELKQVLISRSSASEWNTDDDVLEGRPFPDGATLHIKFSPKTEAEHWDMKVVYSIDNTSHEWDGLNLSKISKVTLHFDADANSTHADVE